MKGLVVVFLLSWSLSAAAAEPVTAPPAANQPVNTACQNKRPEELCKLADGSGGMCMPVECPRGKCLQCLAPLTAEKPSSLWIPMIAFGMTVMLVGSVFWWRLKKLWNNK